MSAAAKTKVDRQCDEAYRVIEGVRDDLGFTEAIALFRSQLTAAYVLFSRQVGSPEGGEALVTNEMLGFLNTMHDLRRRIRG